MPSSTADSDLEQASEPDSPFVLPRMDSRPKKTSRYIPRNATRVRWFLYFSALLFATLIALVYFRERLPSVSAPPHDPRLKIGESGAVAAENPLCSEIGVNLLKKGGSAVDAAVGAAFCIGVTNPQSSGIGGGGFMLIKLGQTATMIDFRESAPGASHERMFVNDTLESRTGAKSIAVPGEVRGLEYAHKKFGRLGWKEVIEPSIRLCLDGFNVNKRLASYLQFILKRPEWQWDFAPKGEILKENDICRRVNLGSTLQKIADFGSQVFYEGVIARNIVNNVREKGGFVTLEDFMNYRAVERDVIESTFKEYQLITTSAPTSGPVLSAVLNIIENMDFSQLKNDDKVHQVIEAIKFGYAQRALLADPDVEPTVNDHVGNITSKEMARMLAERISLKHTYPINFYEPKSYMKDIPGTMHLSAVDAQNMAVSMTSTVNLPFGSRMMDPTTGVILNDEMDDFSTPDSTNSFGYPPSALNFPKPNKRPLSSATPFIFHNPVTGYVMVGGASGGSRIISACVQVIVNHIVKKMDLLESVTAPRLHHQLFPNELRVEYEFDRSITDSLLRKEHDIYRMAKGVVESGVQVITKDGDEIQAVSDSRKGGLAAAY